MELIAIGTILTPYATLSDCPRNIGLNSDECRIALFEQYWPGLNGLEPGSDIEILYWLDQAKQTGLIQSSRKTGEQKGVFALRTPNRPNPIGSAVVTIESLTGSGVSVRGLDCLNGTALLDIKPAYSG
jgi:tRNA-Thr(GGU) m(6)t(6)A37 methyltransferase TsaA